LEAGSWRSRSSGPTEVGSSPVTRSFGWPAWSSRSRSFWGYLPILVSARRRAVFDVMAGTIVTVAPKASAGGDPVTIRSGHP
jgi:hypothetical protein